MRAPKPAPDEPSVRSIIVPAFRSTMLAMWGEPGRDRIAALLDEEARGELLREVAADRDWFPARHLIAWTFAAWEGPAGRRREEMAEFVRRQWDASFGVIRRLLVHMAAPTMVIARLPAIWKQDHSAGALTATVDEDGRAATIEISDTPFVDTPHARASMAETYRHGLAQTRARNVTESHALDGPRRMRIRLRWT